MSIDNKSFTEGYAAISEAAQEQGKVLPPWRQKLICVDSGLKVRSVKGCNTHEEARIKARRKALGHEFWLRVAGIQTILHGFEETEEQANRAVFDISNHPHGLEANSALARYPANIAGQVSIVLKSELLEMKHGIGDGVANLNPVVVQRPDKSLSLREKLVASKPIMQQVDRETLARIEEGGRALSFLEGTRNAKKLGKLQPDLCQDTFKYIQSNPDKPSLLVVKTASINGAFPDPYESIMKKDVETSVNRSPVHYFRNILDIDGLTVQDILAEAEQIQRTNIRFAIDADLERLDV